MYCANCLEVFRSKGKECAHILDAVFGCGPASTPALEEKRLNTLGLKGKIMAELENRSFEPETLPFDSLVIRVPEDVRASMEDRLITDRDVREAIKAAEDAGDYFIDQDGVRTACLVRKVMTYWVDYLPEDGGYSVRSAYCHRMRIGGEDA